MNKGTRVGSLLAFCLLLTALVILPENSGAYQNFDDGALMWAAAETEEVEEETEPRLTVTSEVPFRYRKKPAWFWVLLVGGIALILAGFVTLILWQRRRCLEKKEEAEGEPVQIADQKQDQKQDSEKELKSKPKEESRFALKLELKPEVKSELKAKAKSGLKAKRKR